MPATTFEDLPNEMILEINRYLSIEDEFSQNYRLKQLALSAPHVSFSIDNLRFYHGRKYESIQIKLFWGNSFAAAREFMNFEITCHTLKLSQSNICFAEHVKHCHLVIDSNCDWFSLMIDQVLSLPYVTVRGQELKYISHGIVSLKRSNNVTSYLNVDLSDNHTVLIHNRTKIYFNDIPVSLVASDDPEKPRIFSRTMRSLDITDACMYYFRQQAGDHARYRVSGLKFMFSSNYNYTISATVVGC